MIMAVLDTNIIVRGHISPHGASANVLDAFYDRWYVWVTSPLIIREIDEVLRRPNIRILTGMSLAEIDEFMDLLWLETEVVPGMFEIEKIELDPTDDKFIAAAFEGRADYIVTEDALHLLPIKEYRLIDHIVQLVTASKFLSILTVGGAYIP